MKLARRQGGKFGWTYAVHKQALIDTSTVVESRVDDGWTALYEKNCVGAQNALLDAYRYLGEMLAHDEVRESGRPSVTSFAPVELSTADRSVGRLAEQVESKCICDADPFDYDPNAIDDELALEITPMPEEGQDVEGSFIPTTMQRRRQLLNEFNGSTTKGKKPVSNRIVIQEGYDLPFAAYRRKRIPKRTVGKRKKGGASRMRACARQWKGLRKGRGKYQSFMRKCLKGKRR